VVLKLKLDVAVDRDGAPEAQMLDEEAVLLGCLPHEGGGRLIVWKS
jgi:hypothetical protein